MPVNDVTKAPITKIKQPERPDALPDNSRFTFITAALALGVASPFPTPTLSTPSNTTLKSLCPKSSSVKLIVSPMVPNPRPYKIIIFKLWLKDMRPDRQLPNINPQVIEPMKMPVVASFAPNSAVAKSGIPVTNTKKPPIPQAITIE